MRYAMRQLVKSPVFALTAVLTLALGIGANTAIFTVVYATLLAPMPYPEPDQLVMVWSKIQGNRNGIAAQDYLDWRRPEQGVSGSECLDRRQLQPGHQGSARVHRRASGPRRACTE